MLLLDSIRIKTGKVQHTTCGHSQLAWQQHPLSNISEKKYRVTCVFPRLCCMFCYENQCQTLKRFPYCFHAEEAATQYSCRRTPWTEWFSGGNMKKHMVTKSRHDQRLTCTSACQWVLLLFSLLIN